MQIEIFPVKMQVVCISINTSYVSILSLHKTWDCLLSDVSVFFSFKAGVLTNGMETFTTY